MKTKLLVSLVALVFVSSLVDVSACTACYGNYGPGGSGAPPHAVQHMAAAIWFMTAAIMSVLGGVGAFSFHLWRHSRMPLEPHQQLTQENLEQYD
ncbi:MAG TPA: hypothetical protein VGC85_07405 [Chthoniobacterales bacterium]|jgi:hypothetical protein